MTKNQDDAEVEVVYNNEELSGPSGKFTETLVRDIVRGEFSVDYAENPPELSGPSGKFTETLVKDIVNGEVSINLADD